MDNFDLKPLDKSRYGEFFGGDCYVIQYTYEVHGRENVIIYYWLVSGQTKGVCVCMWVGFKGWQ